MPIKYYHTIMHFIKQKSNRTPPISGSLAGSPKFPKKSPENTLPNPASYLFHAFKFLLFFAIFAPIVP